MNYAAALALARIAHASQVDKAGEPYLDHVIRVAERAAEIARGDHILRNIVREAGVLHDILEDNQGASPDALRELGFSSTVVRIVERVSFGLQGERRYIEKIRDLIATGDTLAMIVKLADVEDNSDEARLKRAAHRIGGAEVERLRVKYQKPRIALREALGMPA